MPRPAPFLGMSILSSSSSEASLKPIPLITLSGSTPIPLATFLALDFNVFFGSFAALALSFAACGPFPIPLITRSGSTPIPLTTFLTLDSFIFIFLPRMASIKPSGSWLVMSFSSYLIILSGDVKFFLRMIVFNTTSNSSLFLSYVTATGMFKSD